MVPAYHDAVTAAIFAIFGALAMGYGVGKYPDAEDIPGSIWLSLSFLLIAFIYILVWSVPR